MALSWDDTRMARAPGARLRMIVRSPTPGELSEPYWEASTSVAVVSGVRLCSATHPPKEAQMYLKSAAKARWRKCTSNLTLMYLKSDKRRKCISDLSQLDLKFVADQLMRKTSLRPRRAWI